MRRIFVTVLGVVVLLTAVVPPSDALAPVPLQQPAPETAVLSPIWEPLIRQWSAEIGVLSRIHGLDPDFIAAVIKEESNGVDSLVSSAGAVGLMGVMPRGPGLEWRPSPESLLNPTTNLRWGVSILSDVVQQSGGDLFSALAAYSGGWEEINSRIPREYAASVLDNYGRAVAAREGIAPDIAAQWTIAIEIRHGYIPHESLLILGNQPVSGLRLYGKHHVYSALGEGGHLYRIDGYAVPVALVVPLAEAMADLGDSHALPAAIQGQGESVLIKGAAQNPHVLIACLPSLTRLRGLSSTRWFAPSSCPDWHR